MPSHIIAMGGGGFSMTTPDSALDRYILAQTGKDRANVAFLGQASAEAESYLDKFHAAFEAMGQEHSHLSLFKPHTADIESYLLAQDVIYVGGGNTKSMLALWREWGVDVMLRKALASGIVLAGISAGAICWFQQGLTDSIPGDLTTLACLGFLAGSATPHYDGEPMRRPTTLDKIGAGAMQPGYAMCDDAAAHFVDGQLVRCVATRPDAFVYHVTREDDTARETPLDMTLLT